MLGNYLVAALRNLLRNKLVATINIVGLAVGFAAAILIGLYIRYEISYDRFVPGYERVFRVFGVEHQPGVAPTIWGAVDHRIARWLELDFPEVEASTRIDEAWFSVGHDATAYNEQVFVADPDFFRVIPVRAIAGDLDTALDTPDGLVITRAMARKYFGRDDPIGESLEIEGRFPVRVTAIIEDLPGNTQFNFRIVASARAPFWRFAQLDAQPDNRAPSNASYVYFRTRPGAAPAAMQATLQAALPELVKRHLNAVGGKHAELLLIPLVDVHLAPADRWWNMTPPGNTNALYALGLVGLLIVVIAIINFVNLTTARAAQRGVEIGVRKVTGARQRDLVLQFVGESMLYVFTAMILAMAIVELALPYFRMLLDPGEEHLTAPTISFDYLSDPKLSATLLGASLLAGVLAGAYPAFVMARFRPTAALKRSAFGSDIRSGTRQFFVALQIAVLVGLIFATAVVHRQTQFAMNAGMRIDTEQVLLVWFRHGPAREAFKNSVAELKGVTAVTSSMAAPTKYNFINQPFRTTSGGEAWLTITMVDFDWFDFYGLQPLTGRFFSEKRGTDRLVSNDATRHWSLVVNESAVRSLGFAQPQDAIGKPLIPVNWPTDRVAAPASITIVGVTPDFPVDSVRLPIEPTAYGADPMGSRIVSVRLQGNDIPETLEEIDQLWSKFGEPGAIASSFLDDLYHGMYIDIIKQNRMLSVLSGVAVLLACLGLFGLSLFLAQQRTKEIGIRKAMGAGRSEVMKLLLWAFAKPVFWASLIAWPVVVWAMSRWLNGFIYRVELGWWLLPLASLLALAITLLTVSVHTYLIARSKPVEALRYE